MDFHYQGFWRMDWGLGNPNKTAIVIATSMVAVWGLSYFRRWGFLAALFAFTGLGVCLVQTYSRGGVLAAAVGLGCVVALSKPSFEWWKSLAVVMSLLLLVGIAFKFSAADRYIQGLETEDRSINNRLEIWKDVPRMMVDAPSGWGIGKAGDAYMQWYQPTERLEVYRTLVNMHLTWLVELGWPLRVAYFALVFFILYLCFPRSDTRWMAIPLGIWMAFFVGGFFSTVGEALWVWVIPTLGLTTVLIVRFLKRDWPPIPMFALCIVGSCVLCIALWGIGQNRAGVRGGNSVTIVGAGEPASWVKVDKRVIGKVFGKALRKEQSGSCKSKTVAFVESLRDIPLGSAGKIIVAGNISPSDASLLEVLGKTHQVQLLCPQFAPSDILFGPITFPNITVIYGELVENPIRLEWESVTRVQLISGAADFLPCWTEIVLTRDEN